MASYCNFIFSLDNDDFFFERIKTIVTKFYEKRKKQNPIIQEEGKRLVIDFQGYNFIFSYIREDWIIEESKDIAETFAKNTPYKNQIKNSEARIEFYGDDDFNMDYFNEALFLLEVIFKEGNAAIFDTVSGKFLDY